MYRLFLLLLISLAFCLLGKGPLAPAKIFSDNMVLQRGFIVPVWGKADAGAKVKVTFAGQSLETIANNNGQWKVRFRPMKASRKGGSMKIISGSQQILIDDVLIGDVWFAGGQSNMDYRVKGMARSLSEARE